MNKIKDLVSIIMPSYNSGRFIAETINSVLNQTYSNWELIIVDDCSSDNTGEIIKEYKKRYSNIIYKVLEKNSGAAIARNEALKLAQGKYIAFLDSDDIWMPEKLEKQIDFMKKNNYSFTYTDYKIKLNGKLQPYVITAPNKVNKIKMYNYCYFSTITVMYDREKIGLVQIKDLKKNNDYAMWLKIIEKENAYRLAECLAIYNKHSNSISRNKMKLIKYHYILFRRGLNKKIFIAIILTINNLFWGSLKKIFYKKKIKNKEKMKNEY